MMWRVIVGALLVCLLGVGGWTATRTATMSDRHPTRPEFTRMADKIDKIYEYLIEGKH